jgi:iron(II)-dependent oxidoreductase
MLWTLACADGPSSDTAAAVPAQATVEIPAATFWMGCDEAVDPECQEDELPGREVTMTAFVIDQREVTRGDWRECEAAYACAPPGVDAPDWAPVTGIPKEDAEGYCQWRGMGLPTEAQWELAARGTDARLYPWGDESPSCDLANLRRCDRGLQAPGQHPDGASPYGLLDMTSNAWEWVSDFYSPDWYADGDDSDPTGPTAGGLQTVRGVDHYTDDAPLRASDREIAILGASSALVGFRCALGGA